jgi:hypothetical protein
MPKFDLSRRARLDLVEIGEYTAERWDDAQAERPDAVVCGWRAGSASVRRKPHRQMSSCASVMQV